MLRKNQGTREQMEFFSLEDMVLENHLLRQIDAAIDFNRIYDFVEDLYCEDNGRPSIDPVVLFKIVLIQHIYGIPSLRRTLEEVNMNLAYRWFIGYPLSATIPHFSTVSYNFKHRFNTATVEYVFRWVLKAAANEGCSLFEHSISKNRLWLHCQSRVFLQSEREIYSLPVLKSDENTR